MALQSELPPLGETNNTFDGQKSDDETEEGEDLEEGEILDSGAEAEDDNKEDIKLFSLAEMVKNSPKKSPNKSPKLNAGEESAECTTESSPGSLNLKAENNYGRPERYFSKFRNMEYVDHDRMSDEDGNADCKKWFERSHSKKIRDGNERMDYRKELANHLDSDGSLDPCVKGEKKKKRKTRPKKLSIAKRKKILEKTKKRIKDGKMIHKPCKYYEEGHCHKGSDCPYQHIPKLTKKREICRYYLGGSCKKMKTCPFMHGEFPCKFYHTNTKCFSGDNCRFSHAPLTEDLRNLLHDYLKVYHGDDYHHDKPKKRERETTPIPEPPPKRICLLGSPPRHIKEAEETKRWREEMMHLQREQQIDAFQIHLESNEMPMPNINRRANFYKDSMSSPVKERPMHMNQDFEPRNRMSPNMGNHFNMPNDRFGRMPYENHIQNDSVDWKNIQALIDKKEAPENNFGPIQNHQSIVIKSEPPPAPIDHFYPTSTFSNDMRIKNEPVPEDSELLDEEDEDFRPLRINQDAYDEESMSPRRSADEASPPHVQVEEHPDPDPIVIPNHLPRKQRELMLRIQKHQKLKSTAENEEFQASEDKTESDAEVAQEVEEIAEVKDEMKETLDSSDDDDDDPLTIVLQKLNQTPPPKPKEVLPPQTEKLAPNLNQMLSSIMQKVNENRSGSVYQEQTNNFWTNILSGTVPPVKSDSTSSMAQTNPTNIMADEGNAVRRGLLPCPQMPPLEKPKADVRDPRLKNRDPRMAAAAAAAANTPNSVLKPEIPNMRPLSILPHDVSIGRHQVNPHHKDLNSLIPNQTPAAVVEGLKGTIPYKLRAVSVPPLNYSSYVQASHSDPKLLNDPRLRKLLVPVNATQTPTQASMEKFSVPKPTSILPDLPLFANIVIETNPAPTVESPPIEKPTLPEIQLPQLQPPQLPKVSDPRTRRSIERRLSGNNTPPHLPVAEPHIPLPLAPTLTHMPLPLAPTLTHMPLPLAPPTLTHMPLPLAPPTLTHMPLPLAPPTLTHMPLPLAPPTLTHMPLPLAPPTLTHMPLPLAPPITHMPLPLAPPITHIPLPLAPTFTKSSVIPTPASHLPRSMADPRMARLQDPRRTRTLSDSINKNLIRQPPELKKPTPPIIDITEEVIDITQPTPPTEPDKEGSTSSEVIVVKPPEEKTKRNKAVHRNRKTSMDYASPLNSCNDSRASENLNFNNYNKRPKRPAVNTPLRDAPASDVMPVLAPIVMGSPIIPEFSTSDNSNLDSDSMDSNLAASLKDVFKTRDPTASPFC